LIISFFQATTEKLLDLLVDEHQLNDDLNYVQDFLLTYRTFIDNPLVITTKLLEYFDQNIRSTSCEHIARVVLSWVNNHFNDFETNMDLYEFLETFDDRLQNHETEVKELLFCFVFIIDFDFVANSFVEIFDKFSLLYKSNGSNDNNDTFDTRRCAEF